MSSCHIFLSSSSDCSDNEPATPVHKRVRRETSVLEKKEMRLTVGLLAFICPPLAFTQAKPPPEFFVVCSSQVNLPTVYFSGVLQGPATSFQGFRSGFIGFLEQRYAYKGGGGCAPARDAAAAQNIVNTMATRIRNGKRVAVETGWTESAVVAGAPALPAATAKVQAAVQPAAAAPPPAKAAATGVSGTGSASSSAGGNSAAGSNQLSSVLSSIFGTGGGSSTGTGTSGAQSGGSKSATSSSGAAANTGGTGSGATAAGQSPFNQVSSALSNVFSKAGGGTANAAAKQGLPDGALGSAKSQTTQLVVFGCGRQDVQVACVNDVTNQNQKDTLVQASDVWKDTFIVDDCGDRHQRSKGFFLNIDGDQRDQMDIAYGKTARFILMFDNVPTKVQKVALRSSAGELDVEGIALVAPGGAAH
jgi:hypothetical protein